MPEAVRKQPSVVQPCVDTPFNDFLHPSTAPPTLHPLHSTIILLILTISLLLGFFGRFLYLEGCWEGLCCVGWKFNQVRFFSQFDADLSFHYRYRLSTRRRMDILSQRDRTTDVCAAGSSSGCVRGSSPQPFADPMICGSTPPPPFALFLRRWAINSQLTPHPFLLLLLLLPRSKSFFSSRLRVPLAPILAQIRRHPPLDSCIGRTTALDSGPWMEIRPSPVSTLVLHVVPFPDNRRWKSPR